MAWCTWCIEIMVSTILQTENKKKKIGDCGSEPAMTVATPLTHQGLPHTVIAGLTRNLLTPNRNTTTKQSIKKVFWIKEDNCPRPEDKSQQ